MRRDCLPPHVPCSGSKQPTQTCPPRQTLLCRRAVLHPNLVPLLPHLMSLGGPFSKIDVSSASTADVFLFISDEPFLQAELPVPQPAPFARNGHAGYNWMSLLHVNQCRAGFCCMSLPNVDAAQDSA